MRYMSRLLDSLPLPVASDASPPPPPPLPPPPPPESTAAALSRWVAVAWAALGRLQTRTQRRPRPARVYAKPQHMPVLMSTEVLAEMEALWPDDFAATRRNRLRASEELEMNFLYHHYVRWQRYHAIEMPNRRVGFGWMHECGEKGGVARCARKLSPLVHDWVCFNDKEVSTRVYEAGAGTLRRLLHRRYGTFSGAEWSASPSAAAAEEAEETRAEQASRMPFKPPQTRGSHHHHHQSLPCHAGRALSPRTCGVHFYHHHPNPTNPTVPCLLAWRANHA